MDCGLWLVRGAGKGPGARGDGAHQIGGHVQEGCGQSTRGSQHGLAKLLHGLHFLLTAAPHQPAAQRKGTEAGFRQQRKTTSPREPPVPVPKLVLVLIEVLFHRVQPVVATHSPLFQRHLFSLICYLHRTRFGLSIASPPMQLFLKGRRPRALKQPTKEGFGTSKPSTYIFF